MTREQFHAHLERDQRTHTRCRECQFWMRVRNDDTMHRCTNQVSEFNLLHTLGSMTCHGGRKATPRSN